MGLGQILPERGSDYDEHTACGEGWNDSQGDQSFIASLEPVLERLRKRHLLREGAYLRLRSLLPIPGLVAVWYYATHEHLAFTPGSVINSSITLRHLFVGIGACLLWGVTAARRGRPLQTLRRDLESEILALLRGCLACGAFLFLGSAAHLGAREAAELGLSLAAVLLTESLLLLSGALLVCSRLIRYPARPRKALIIGSGARSSVLRRLAQASHSHLEIVGCLDDEYVGLDRMTDRYMGKLSVLPELLKAHPVELVLIGLPVKSQYHKIQQVIQLCETVGVECHYMADIFATSRVRLQKSVPAPAEVAVLGDPPRDIRHWVKRSIDVVVAGTMFIFLLPILGVIALAIKLTSPGPVLFVQLRYGYQRRRFPMLKFRTMVADAEQRQAALEASNEASGPVFKLKADPRITKIGRFLRRTSLDELPQLINVLRGEMSLVGPRPLPLRDVSRFDEPWLLRRFSVRPGLTCLWQVGGRSNTQFDEWIRLDLQYIDQWTLGLDLRILAQTIPAVLRGSGAM